MFLSSMHYKEVIHYKLLFSMYCTLFKLIKITFFKISQNKLLFSFSIIKFDTVVSHMNNCLQFYESHSNGHSFTTGLTSVPSPTCSFATHTRPSTPGYTSTTRPRGQFPRAVSGETTSTTSPTCRSRRSRCHFVRAPRLGSHS